MEKPSKIKRLIHCLMALDRVDHSIQTETIPLPCPGLPTAFHGARIAVVADVHLPDQLIPIPDLVACVKAARPDAIFLPGDLTNSYTDFDADGLRQLATALAAIAPCFATAGNHEFRLEREPLYREILTACGVHYLCGNYDAWHHKGDTLRLYGMGREKANPPNAEGHPAIALAHHPEYFPLYQEAGWDLVIAGHAHGGHVRWKRGALFSPDQGFFPKYTQGVYEAGTTRMVVSRGLGNSSLPWRLNNHPHLPILVLCAKE